ncbi:hypothetical protein [Enterobacillus tribolii]|uniref:Uncharacterized protein n=1 Tax=Enterobacillus tribolii TaxID=1487935 RepID=A0A370QSL1_9GAMM|nr:hypothetical protein [Enterobacillus tribolii]MBW7983618.1 hypothetical protein [Enterobacillus tribolii]RDK91883.1 hypothetical protein C8D90_10427 [Enterobacillus tribolii]
MRIIDNAVRYMLLSVMTLACGDVFAVQKFGFHQQCGALDTPLNINIELNLGDKNANYGVNVIYIYSDRISKETAALYPQMPAFSFIKNNASGVLCINGCGYASSPSVDKGQSKYNVINTGGNSGYVYNTSIRTENVKKSRNTNIIIPTRRLALLRIEGFIMPGGLGPYERTQYSRLVGVYGAAFYEPLIIEYVETDVPGVMKLSQVEYGNSRNKNGYPVPDVNMKIGRKKSLNIKMQGNSSRGVFDVPSSLTTTEWSTIPDCAK